MQKQGGGLGNKFPATLSFYPPASYLHRPLVKPKDSRGQRRLGDVVHRDGLPGQRAVQRDRKWGSRRDGSKWKLNGTGFPSLIPSLSRFSAKLHASGTIKPMLHLQRAKGKPSRTSRGCLLRVHKEPSSLRVVQLHLQGHSMGVWGSRS